VTCFFEINEIHVSHKILMDDKKKGRSNKYIRPIHPPRLSNKQLAKKSGKGA